MSSLLDEQISNSLHEAFGPIPCIALAVTIEAMLILTMSVLALRPLIQCPKSPQRGSYSQRNVKSCIQSASHT